MFKPKLRYFLIFFVFTSFFSGCKNENNYIPYVYVNMYVHLSDPDFFELNAVGNAVFYNYEGYKGLIIFRSSMDDFLVYDRCCTYEPTVDCEIVDKTDDSYIVKCNCCGSVFSLYDGYPFEGSAKLPLKSYNVSFDGNNTLQIYN